MSYRRQIKHYLFMSFFLTGALISAFEARAITAPAETALDCSRTSGSLPFDHLRAGTSNSKIPIEHTVVIMQENHSFDNYFGQLSQEKYYGKEIDGVTPDMKNLDSKGVSVFVHHEPSLCSKNPRHTWDGMHSDWNNGKNDRFVINSGVDAIGYYDENDLNFYYDLANRFAVADRYFASAMTQTFPNRFFMLTASAFGHVRNDIPKSTMGYSQKTIFETLNDYNVSWKYYRNGVGYLDLFTDFWLHNTSHVAKIAQFTADLENENLPQVVFVDSDMDGQDEHPSGNIQEGESFVAKRIGEFIASPYWKNSVLFLTYDEGGGFFDHVPPPVACEPDAIKPKLGKKETIKASYDRYGFRVPFIAISPFAKPHFVSHLTHDHTSILKFIESKYNLPALTARDANADDLSDIFDFEHPRFDVQLSAPKIIKVKCKKE